MVFLSPSSQMLEQFFKTDNDHFPSYPFNTNISDHSSHIHKLLFSNTTEVNQQSFHPSPFRNEWIQWLRLASWNGSFELGFPVHKDGNSTVSGTLIFYERPEQWLRPKKLELIHHLYCLPNSASATALLRPRCAGSTVSKQNKKLINNLGNRGGDDWQTKLHQ